MRLSASKALTCLQIMENTFISSPYLPPEPLESVLPFINISNRDTAVPIFLYGPDLTRVLYVFNSKTSLYNEFNIH